MLRLKVLFPALTALVLVISGCNSGSDDNNNGTVVPSSGSISGIVAVGAGLEATVILQDANGDEKSGTSNADGEFTFDVSGMTPPYIIRAVAGDGRTLYSYSNGQSSRVNVTPITSYILEEVARANGQSGGVSELFSEFSSHNSLDTAIQAAVTAANTVLAAEMGDSLGSFDHFSSEFSADHTGYDGFLDNLDIEMENDEIVIRVNDDVLNTLSYDIDPDVNITVSGQIIDASTQTGISGATLTFTYVEGATTQTVTATTDSNGQYSVSLPSFRTYDLTIESTGFSPVEYENVSSFALSSVSTQLIPLIDSSISGDGTVEGTLINARTSSTAVEGAILTFREGINQRTGAHAAAALTNSSGSYTASLETGIYTVEITKNGYITNYATVYSIGGQTTTYELSIVPSTATTSSNGAFAAITLTWGENPWDLDSHLTGPMADDRFHTAYYDALVLADSNTTYWGEDGNYSSYENVDGTYVLNSYETNTSNPCQDDNIIAVLDRDDTSSYGPETTTICHVEDGEYRYYVHHFYGMGTIASSGAQVTVAKADGTTMTFNAPASGATGENDVWHVFNIDASGNITPVNAYLPYMTDSETLQSTIRSRTNDTRYYLVGNLPAK